MVFGRLREKTWKKTWENMGKLGKNMEKLRNVWNKHGDFDKDTW